MAAGIKESVSGLAKEFANLYKDLVTNTAQYEELRKYIKESLDSFRHSLERLQDKLELYERENIKTTAELRADIKSLHQRLDMLSRDALHAAAKDAAMTVMEKMIKEERIIEDLKEEKKGLKGKK